MGKAPKWIDIKKRPQSQGRHQGASISSVFTQPIGDPEELPEVFASQRSGWQIVRRRF
jgi:hypothetical protein